MIPQKKCQMFGIMRKRSSSQQEAETKILNGRSRQLGRRTAAPFVKTMKVSAKDFVRMPQKNPFQKSPLAPLPSAATATPTSNRQQPVIEPSQPRRSFEM